METGLLRSRATPWFVLCTAVAALYFGREILSPIALAAFIAFLFAPLVIGLTRKRVPRALATTLVLGGAAIIVGSIGWLVIGQLQSFSEHLPEYRSNLREKIADFRGSYGSRIEKASSTVRALGDELTQQPEQVAAIAAAPATPPATPPVVAPAPPVEGNGGVVQDLIGSFVYFAAQAAFVFFLSWIMLLRWEDLRDRVLELAGRNDLYVTTRATVEASAMVTAYVRKQLLVNVIFGTVLGSVMGWLGVPNPLVWGLLAATLRFIPYLGAAISTVLPLLVSLASSPGWTQTWIAAVALVVLETITSNLIEPWVYGSTTGVSPLAILVSAAFWTWLWGPVGLVLSTPLTVCLVVIGKHFSRMHFLEVLVSDRPPMPDRARLYHRLLADDQDAAWDILRERAARAGELSAADDLLLPALALAGNAVRQGTIDAEQRERIATIASALAHELEDSRAAATPASASPAPRILCLSARDAFDAVGTRLFAAELVQRGFEVPAPKNGALLAEVLQWIERDPACVVCVSSVAPTHFLHVRSLCKRILQANAETRIVLGLWAENLERGEIEQRLPASERIDVATTIAEAVEQTVALAGFASSANRRASAS